MTEFPGMKTVRIQDRPARVYRGDLCVVGSGAAGMSAALQAVGLGQTAVLVDAAHQLGGQAVGAALGTICGLFRNGPVPRRLTHGAMDEFGLVRAEGPVFVVPGTRKLLLNLTHVETPMEPAGLALAGIEGRRQVDGLLRLFKRELPEAVEDNLTRETTDSWAGEAARAAKLTTLRGGPVEDRRPLPRLGVDLPTQPVEFREHRCAPFRKLVHPFLRCIAPAPHKAISRRRAATRPGSGNAQGARAEWRARRQPAEEEIDEWGKSMSGGMRWRWY